MRVLKPERENAEEPLARRQAAVDQILSEDYAGVEELLR